jgi:GAF domain-containing protein
MMLREGSTPEHRACLDRLFAHGMVIVRMRARGRVIGTVTVGRGSPGPHYSDDEVALLQDLADRAALAVENVQLYEAVRQARREARRSAGRTARLQSVTAALASAATPADVAAAVIHEAISALGAQGGALIVDGADGASFETVAETGYGRVANDAYQRWRRFAADVPTPVRDAIQTRDLVVLGSAAERAARYPLLADVAAALGEGAAATIPLLVDRRAVGAIHLTFGAPRTFDADDRALLLTIGRLCAQAIERTRLFAAEQRARAEAETARRRATNLAETSRLLVEASLDGREVLDTVCRQVAAVVGEGCAILTPSADRSSLTVAAVFHPDPSAQSFALALAQQASAGTASLLPT